MLGGVGDGAEVPIYILFVPVSGYLTKGDFWF